MRKICFTGCAAVGLLAMSLMADPAPTTRPSPTTAPATAAVSATVADGNTKKLPDGLVITTTAPGDGSAKPGDVVWVHYTGTLKDGAKFDSSYDRKEPLQFVLGKGQVIKGWDEGVAGMKVGEKRTLVIPPDLAYGATAKPGDATHVGIPANSELHFDVELVGIARVGE